jgi:hypothetical protein
MNFKNFSDLREFIRNYNSTSVLEIGTKKCWQKWETTHTDPLGWLRDNIERNYIVRIMLLASAGNPHRHAPINVQHLDNLINPYHSWNGHTISDERILEEEAKVLSGSILAWEIDHKNIVRTWSLKLSDILDSGVIRNHVASLFVQRLVAFQNAGFGSPSSRISRTIKLIELFENQSNEEFSFSDYFLNRIGLIPKTYFRQFIACLALFGWNSGKKGFCNFSQIPNKIDDKLQEIDINPETIKLFIKQNSAFFTAETDTSFRRKIQRDLAGTPDFYQPFFYNRFLETPFIELKNEEFCLPDPSSFTESCWNQVRNLVFKGDHEKRLGQLLGRVFEDYLENVLLPFICPDSFKRIPEVNHAKRADFLIELPSSYIVIECKTSVMSADTSAYFQADKVSDLWCRIHSAFEQISITVEALKLHGKPVIPLILTFYDSIAASTVFEEIAKQTGYCSRMKLNTPPVVHSLHEFEHWIFNRSLSNWADLILAKQHSYPSVKPDNKGHNYQHLNDVSIL